LYPELRTKRLKPNQPAPEPLTDAEREDMAVNFAHVDEWDRRNRGQQFQ